jgi:hypothetical protein
MSNIHYLNIPFKTPLNINKITDELIELLYDLLPSNFSHWSLKLAQARFNQRHTEGASTWHDKLQVYVGLADWVLTEEQMLSEQVPHIKCPFGLLETLSDVTESNLNVGIPNKKECTLTGRSYEAIYHSTSFDVSYHSAKLDGDIINGKGDFEFEGDQFERLVTFEIEHVKEKSEYLVSRMKRARIYEENINVLRTALSTCKQLSEGDGELLEAFLGITNLKSEDMVRAKKIYSKLDIGDFYEWASQHFGLDDYYDDAEDLVDHIKCIFRRDEHLLEVNDDYKFAVKMIGRCEPVLHHLNS